MDESVLAAGLVGDEAIAAVGVEEFNGADSPRAKGAAGPWQLEREGEPEGVKFARRRRQRGEM
jgi:hypothetical protein